MGQTKYIGRASLVTLARKGNPWRPLSIAGNKYMTDRIANHQEHFVSDPIWPLL